ncbi:MAG TPA: GH3 auxin-responsive promoter family protein [Anseongella sp.]|nr:GH3 auxin-responsive promoter family protein [Anseongella sp.]
MKSWKTQALSMQESTFHDLLDVGQYTAFGKAHELSSVSNYEEFKAHVPVRDYEMLSPYVNRVVNGEPDVLWKGKPLYLAKTSGTTSGIKYIPITRESMPHHIKAARNALLMYIHETGRSEFTNGKMIFLQGSPTLTEKNGIKVGRLSGIVAHHVPSYLQKNRMPSYRTNCIEDWEQKVDAIVEETLQENMTLVSGIPPWVQMYFDRLSARSGGKKIKDIFPGFSVFVYGGVNFDPYRLKLEQSIGKKVDFIETYPASEGFIAFQDSLEEKGMLLNLEAGIFYEFIPAEEYFNEKPSRLSLKDVETGRNYALVLNTNAGLWGYSIGDTVRFVSKDPYRLVVTGRIKHFISAFGEHVIAEEVEEALMSVAVSEKVGITEFTVAPRVQAEKGELPYHEWFVEFENTPADMEKFRLQVDEALQRKNVYYFDLIKGKVLQPLKIRPVRKGAFIDYMRSQGKLGGQNKVPRLSNDREIAEKLMEYC